MPRLSVVVSQGQSANPVRRKLEEDIITGLMLESGLELIVVPHLYDLSADHTGTLALTGIGGNVVVLSWMYERGCRWTLDRLGVRGQAGVSLIQPEEEQDEEETAEAEEKPRVADDRPVPSRRIYCLDLRLKPDAALYIAEVKRIAQESSLKLMGLGLGMGMTAPPSSGAVTAEQQARFVQPTNNTALPLPGNHPTQNVPVAANSAETSLPQLTRIEADTDRRWYPVIDYSRCTNCMECIDFCLFGVYGVDGAETILVEQPDNCRKGCPACSRVCPENAIIFPQHKTPAIAGADLGATESLKIDLSRLFGAPEAGESAADAAIRERDEQLLLAGRAAVGSTIEPTLVPAASKSADGQKDKFDALLDELDRLDI